MVAARRQQQQKLLTVALLGSVMLVSPHFSTFAMLGSKASPPRTAMPRTAMSAIGYPHVMLPGLNPLPWAEDLEGKDAEMHADIMTAVDKTVDHMEEFDKKLVEGLSLEELHGYDRALVQLIAELEDNIHSSESEILKYAMEAHSESQVVWLESMLQSIGDLRRQLRRVRDQEGKLQHHLMNTNKGFLQNMMRAAAIALGGQKAAPRSDYPASGVSSYTGEPFETSF